VILMSITHAIPSARFSSFGKSTSTLLNPDLPPMAKPTKHSAKVLKTPDLRLSPEVLRQFERLREQLRPIIEGSQGFSEKMRETARLAIPDDFRFPSWEEQEQAYRERLKMLAEHGWYAAIEFPLVTLNQADSLFKQGRQSDANTALTALFDQKAPGIIREVTDLYPETAPLLTRALRAHQEEDYVVSVLILLSQAEGIWGRHAPLSPQNSLSPYSKQSHKIGALQDAINARAADLPIRAYWQLLLHDLPIKRNFDPSDPAPLHLNRHAVMHGAALNFGTKSNSARALSWLSYVAEIRGYFGLFERETTDGSTTRVTP
jgi:hypothetical protein